MYIMSYKEMRGGKGKQRDERCAIRDGMSFVYATTVVTGASIELKDCQM